MAFSTVLRRASAAATRSAQAFIFQKCRSLHLASLSPLLKRGILSRVKPIDLPYFRAVTCFSSYIQKKSDTDTELLRIVESEIKCAKEECREVKKVLEGFPFEIQDDELTSVITLRREYLGENIEVVVSMPTLEEPYASKEVGDEENNGDDEKTGRPAIPLTVNISRGEGSSFEFSCTAYSDGIVIDSLCIRGNKESDNLLAYEGPDFNDLDENLQKAFHKYLEVRGISTATTGLLHEYLVSKDDREYLLWLQNVKHFLEK